MKRLEGLATALVTPMYPNGSIDWESFGKVIGEQLQAGVKILVPVATTGEGPTITIKEHLDIIAEARELAPSVHLMAGTGSNSTSEALELSRGAKERGADSLLVVSPYYNKPSDNGIWDYYEQIAKIGLPIYLYDIPGRTARGLDAELIIKMAKVGVISGMKWASGDFGQLQEVLREAPKNFSVFSGDDALTLPMMALGGHGVVSVTSNVYPGDMRALVEFMLVNDLESARHYQKRLQTVMELMFVETNPVPVKTVLAGLSLIESPTVRSPLAPLESGSLEKLRRYFGF